MLVAAEKTCLFLKKSLLLKTRSLVASTVKNYATVAGTGVDIFDAEAHSSNKVIEIQAVMKRKNWLLKQRHQHWCCFKRLANPWLPLQAKTSLTHQVSKAWQITRKTWNPGGGNIGLNLPALQQTCQGHSPRCLDTFLPRAEPSIVPYKHTWKKMVLELFQNIHITEIKKRWWPSACRTEDETYRLDALLYATGRKTKCRTTSTENTDIELIRTVLLK